MTVKIEAADNAKSRVEIKYVFTALNERGNEYLDKLTKDEFEADMKVWEDSMNYYLETGEILKAAGR